jgi:hypothetical protein
MDMFSMPDLTGIAQQLTPQVTADPSTDSGTGGTGLPQYSWGYDPSTGGWGYFMNKAGSQSAQIGRKAGDKQLSYAAPKNDAASMQQQALQHLLNTQVTANAPTTPTTPQTPTTPVVAGSGIGAAGTGGHGGSNSGMNTDGGGTGDASGLGGIAAFMGNLAQSIGPDTKYGKLLMAGSDAIARNNNPNYSNEGLHSTVPSSTSGTYGQTGDPYGPTTPDAAGAGPASPMSVDPATAAANAAAGLAAANNAYSPGGDLGPGPSSEQMGPPASAMNASDSNGAQVGAGPASPMGGDPASAAAAAQAASDSAASSNDSNYSHEGMHSDSGGDGGGDGGGGGGDGGGGGGGSGATGGLAEASKIKHTRFADGGDVAGLHAVASLPPRMVRGEGDGQSDSIPVKMDDGGQGRLADNEFVVPADAVSALGSGSSEAGARALYAMVDRIRQQAHGTKQQAKPVDPSKVLAA